MEKLIKSFCLLFDTSAIWVGKSQFHGGLRIGRPGTNKIINIFVLKLYMLDENFPLNFRFTW